MENETPEDGDKDPTSLVNSNDEYLMLKEKEIFEFNVQSSRVVKELSLTYEKLYKEYEQAMVKRETIVKELNHKGNEIETNKSKFGVLVQNWSIPNLDEICKEVNLMF